MKLVTHHPRKYWLNFGAGRHSALAGEIPTVEYVVNIVLSMDNWLQASATCLKVNRIWFTFIVLSHKFKDKEIKISMATLK